MAGQLAVGRRGNNGPEPPSADRPGGRRLARGHWVALALGLLAFLVNIAVLRDRSQVVLVAVANESIAPATEITDDMVRYVEVPADSPLASSMVDQDAVEHGALFARRQIVEDEPLVAGAVADDVPEDGLRSMSVPVAREHAAGGTLGVGDRVDVIYTADRPVFAVTDAEVLAIGEETSASAGRTPGEYHVVLAVDAAETLRLAAALDSGKLEVVRATGAPPAPTRGGDVGGDDLPSVDGPFDPADEADEEGGG